MSKGKQSPSGSKRARSRQGRRERYIQPSILLALLRRTSYGYELIRDIHRFGFVEGQAPPGMIYRHLRQMEEDGLVSSEWQTEGTGPAKRIYNITEEGKEVLAIWIDVMKRQAKNLNAFVEMYREVGKKKK
jgi:poly-beta-hydroxybutyrate-responsive repressor